MQLSSTKIFQHTWKISCGINAMVAVVAVVRKREIFVAYSCSIDFSKDIKMRNNSFVDGIDLV